MKCYLVPGTYRCRLHLYISHQPSASPHWLEESGHGTCTPEKLQSPANQGCPWLALPQSINVGIKHHACPIFLNIETSTSTSTHPCVHLGCSTHCLAPPSLAARWARSLAIEPQSRADILACALPPAMSPASRPMQPLTPTPSPSCEKQGISKPEKKILTRSPAISSSQTSPVPAHVTSFATSGLMLEWALRGLHAAFRGRHGASEALTEDHFRRGGPLQLAGSR